MMYVSSSSVLGLDWNVFHPKARPTEKVRRLSHVTAPFTATSFGSGATEQLDGMGRAMTVSEAESYEEIGVDKNVLDEAHPRPDIRPSFVASSVAVSLPG